MDAVSNQWKLRQRAWNITFQSWEHEDEIQEMVEEDIKNGTVKYFVAGREVAPTTGQKHLQAFAYFTNRVGIRYVHKRFGCTGHVQPEKIKFPAQAIAYCKKDGQFFEIGIPPQFERMAVANDAANEKKRTNTADFLAALRRGASDVELSEQFPSQYVQHFSKLEGLRNKLGPELPQSEEIDAIWIWGPGGTGKSRRARWLAEKRGGPVYHKMPSNMWFDGIRPDTDTVIIDDLEECHKSLLDNMKNLADRYVHTLEVKGSVVQVKYRCLIVTSNTSLEAMFSARSNYLGPMMRRFKVVEMSEGVWEPPINAWDDELLRDMKNAPLRKMEPDAPTEEEEEEAEHEVTPLDQMSPLSLAEHGFSKLRCDEKFEEAEEDEFLPPTQCAQWTDSDDEKASEMRRREALMEIRKRKRTSTPEQSLPNPATLAQKQLWAEARRKRAKQFPYGEALYFIDDKAGVDNGKEEADEIDESADILQKMWEDDNHWWESQEFSDEVDEP